MLNATNVAEWKLPLACMDLDVLSYVVSVNQGSAGYSRKSPIVPAQKGLQGKIQGVLQ